MGILNVTPDSFSDGGRYDTVEVAVNRALRLIKEGAEIIDIGGESTRPGAKAISVEDELNRTIPVIEKLRSRSNVYLSIDTSKADVAKHALQAGADIVNDVTGLTADDNMVSVCAEFNAAVVVMHMKGNPRTMQNAPCYNNVTDEVLDFFKERLKTLEAAGIAKTRICFDPGIGFGKTINHNKELLKNIETFFVEGRPCLIGASRKSFIGKILNVSEPEEREWGTAAVTAYTRRFGVSLHRVHDVKKNHEAMRMVEAIMSL